jgi:hypothetical protein
LYYRRNKYLMGEQVRACGVRAVAQQRVTKWEDADAWLKQQSVPLKVIIKPSEYWVNLFVCYLLNIFLISHANLGWVVFFFFTSVDDVRAKYDFLMVDAIHCPIASVSASLLISCHHYNL